MQVPQSAALAAFNVEALAALAMAALAAAAIALAAGSLIRRLLRSIEGERFHTRPITNATVRVVGTVTFFLALMVLAFPALDMAGVKLTVGLQQEDLTQWLTNNGARILLLLLLAYAANRFAASVIRNAEEEIGAGDDLKTAERRKRLHTVGATSRRFFAVLIWTAATLMVLRELDVDITPVLTGAGIIGLAVGFGAQTLVKDILSGLLMIAEDQVRLGDVAQINGITGAVEEINLRTIVLRDHEGVVHIIANGEIRTLANRSKDFSYHVIDIGVGYDDDTDRVVEVVGAVARELMQDPAYATTILEPLEVLGIEPTGLTLRFRIKTTPMKQGDVGRELRRRIRKAFEAHGIRIAVPQVHVTSAKAESV